MRYWVPRSDPKGGHDFSHTPGRNPLPSADPPLPSHMIGTKSRLSVLLLPPLRMLVLDEDPINIVNCAGYLSLNAMIAVESTTAVSTSISTSLLADVLPKRMFFIDTLALTRY
uniref:Uncharacterized protein n=1 Tax=Amphimedon queenslandica TaxID=400682 RepID=A0A1X7T363_AMPQE